MIIKKIIETGLNIKNPIELYSNRDENILALLTKIYEGVCFRTCYILKVLRIVQLSECVILQESIIGEGRVYVRFEVEAMIFYAGETIHGCIINTKQLNGIIMCSTNYADIYLAAHDLLKSVQVGQIISIRVGRATYKLYMPKISINAIPMVFSKGSIIFSLPLVELSEEDKDRFVDAMSRLKYEREQASALMESNASGWNTFNELLYAWKTKQSAPNNVTIISLLDTINSGILPSGYVSQDSRIDLSTDNIWLYNELPNDLENLVVKEEELPQQVYMSMLESHISHLRNIREILAIYNTEALIRDHANIWLMIKKTKLMN